MTAVSDSPQSGADALLEKALEETGARDPREFYRARLKELREQSREAYERAVTHYRDRLLPAIVEERADPLAAWTEYGRVLAELVAPGRTLTVDPTGRASAYEAPSRRDHLILHLPDNRRMRAILVGLPPELSAAQRATFDWLVQGRNTLRDAS